VKKGFTLIEVIIVIAMLAVLTAASAYIYHAILLAWSSQEKRAGIVTDIDRAIEELARDLREAKQVQSADDEIRFTRDNSAYYIYYLYNANDTYPLSFNQSSYQLRKAPLTAGISGNFTYGSGQIILNDMLSPPTSDLSMSGNIITIDASIQRATETIRSRTQVKPRNI
jgi:prepilin-type N-terminal cleavage/methylation domain-containing protein